METHNHLILDLYGAAQECTPTEFSEYALLQLKRAVAFDSAVVLNIDTQTDGEMAVRSMHLSNQPPDQLLAWDQLDTPDYVLNEALQRRGVALARSSRDTFGRHADFMDYCDRYDIAHTLILIPPETTPNNHDLISLWRAHPDRHFSTDDSLASSLMLPHFFQSGQINRRLFANQEAHPALRVSLLANLAGCLHFAPRDAIALLQSEWREWAPPFLPTALIHGLSADPSRRYSGRHIVVKADVLGQTLHLQIAPQPATARLTGAEWNVAKLAADGMSYKEIARELGNSPATVRNQLHSVYAKLGVENKTQLSAALLMIVAP
ncbi:regulatory protein, luxR family [Duganella sp. CF402]|uniref:helix-turn-helix transcriptional regulator n=1 Tax=unclassified Duganella TaxID=2636909 RepID=UPI0008CBF3AA|nr:MULTISPECIES: helix-turn-helix transcriptional regulator [unclassified Duganella]RZT11257.1 LuxR family transcriptional regulator [Duganella sp. BK701]SEK73956.1 regulatory protein, luxR family [Duganella sp. CF402]